MSNIHASKLTDLKAYTNRIFIHNRDQTLHKLIKVHKGKIKLSDVDTNLLESDFRNRYSLVVNQ